MRLLRAYPAAWRERYGEEWRRLIVELRRPSRESPGTLVRHRPRGPARARSRARAARACAPGTRTGDRCAPSTPDALRPRRLRRREGIRALAGSDTGGQARRSRRRVRRPAQTAGVGSALVVLGVALILPRLAALIRGGGWAGIRRPILRALVLSACAAAATIGLALWAHSLTPAQRNGHDTLYGAVFVAWILVVASCLFAWASAAAAAARRLRYRWAATGRDLARRRSERLDARDDGGDRRLVESPRKCRTGLEPGAALGADGRRHAARAARREHEP